MKRDNLPWRPVQPATLRWSETGVPISNNFDDVYYSQDNGLEESRHVFLLGNTLVQRWQQHTGRHFCIGELGFGSGLNFLLTWQAWRDLPAPRPDLHFLSIEKHPLTRQDLARALATWPTLATLAEALLASYPPLLAGQHRLVLEAGVRLDLWWEDAADALTDLAGRGQPLVDAWYLDGFAPTRNETMWSSQVMNAIAALSHPGASFSTFTAAGHVRRKLTEAGFTVSKVPGYGRKRECLRGVLEGQSSLAAAFATSPWDLSNCTQNKPDHVLVVGGGLAGCTTAAALAARGIAVTLLDHGALCSGGSGNDQGILYTRLSRKHSALVDFALQAFQFAAHFYRVMFLTGTLQAPRDGELCGYFQQSHNTQEMDALREVLVGLEDLAQVLDPAQASELLGIQQPCAGYWYPGSGWLQPSAVCRALTASDTIRVVENCGAVALHTDGNTWQATAGGKVLAQASVAIVATGAGSTAMTQFRWLPLQTIRGQITELPQTQATRGLRAALCHEGYIAPARNGIHSIGASFNVHVSDPAPRACDNRDNLAKLATAVPAWQAPLDALDARTLASRVGYRCTSPDYLPVVGPAPAYDDFLRDFGFLRKNARQSITHPGRYTPGLYLNAAHGSRGLASTPIAAELLASMICGEPLPLSRPLCRALSPARFIIRDLSRNRIPDMMTLRILLLLAACLPLAAWPAPPSTPVQHYTVKVIGQKAQSRDNFVQGLEILDDYLYVSAGNYGESRLLRYRFADGHLDRGQTVDERIFAEGLTILGEHIYQLTWQNKAMLVYRKSDLEYQHWLPLAGEGWGLTNNGTELIYSDGSAQLHFMSPDSARVLRSITVTEQGRPVTMLNELEWIDGAIWANIWQSDRIVIIDPASGDVTASIDLQGLLPRPEYRQGTDVLNGIARNPADGAIWVTGKRWPWLYRIELQSVVDIPETQQSESNSR